MKSLLVSQIAAMLASSGPNVWQLMAPPVHTSNAHIGGGNANTTRGFNRLSQKDKRRRARQQRSQSFKGGAK